MKFSKVNKNMLNVLILLKNIFLINFAKKESFVIFSNKIIYDNKNVYFNYVLQFREGEN